MKTLTPFTETHRQRRAVRLHWLATLVLYRDRFGGATSLTLRFSDGFLQVSGVDYPALAKTWGRVGEALSATGPGVSGGTADPVLFNTMPIGGAARFTDLLRAGLNASGYDLPTADLTLQAAFEGGADSDAVTLFVAQAEDLANLTEETVTLRCTDRGRLLDVSVEGVVPRVVVLFNGLYVPTLIADHLPDGTASVSFESGADFGVAGAELDSMTSDQSKTEPFRSVYFPTRPEIEALGGGSGRFDSVSDTIGPVQGPPDGQGTADPTLGLQLMTLTPAPASDWRIEELDVPSDLIVALRAGGVAYSVKSVLAVNPSVGFTIPGPLAGRWFAVRLDVLTGGADRVNAEFGLTKIPPFWMMALDSEHSGGNLFGLVQGRQINGFPNNVQFPAGGIAAGGEELHVTATTERLWVLARDPLAFPGTTLHLALDYPDTVTGHFDVVVRTTTLTAARFGEPTTDQQRYDYTHLPALGSVLGVASVAAGSHSGQVTLAVPISSSQSGFVIRLEQVSGGDALMWAPTSGLVTFD